MTYYVDSSALVKLVIRDRETEALTRWLRASDRTLVSSDLARAELMRAVRRIDVGAEFVARQVLESIELVALPADAFERAGMLAPASMRSLDAIHLAAALRLGDALHAVITYDQRMAASAEALGIAVVQPG